MIRLFRLLRVFSAELLFISSLAFTVFLGAKNKSVFLDIINLSSTEISCLSTVFFMLYAFSQVYSGKLKVILPLKYIFLVSTFFVILGKSVSETTNDKLILCIAQAFLIIGGASFFIGFILTRQTNISNHFSILIRSMEQNTINFCMGVFEFAASILFTKFGYKLSFISLSINFSLCALLILIFFRNNEINVDLKGTYSEIKVLLCNKQLWFITLFFSGLSSAVLIYINVVTVLQANVFNLKYYLLTSPTSLGFAISAIFTGYLSNKAINYRWFFQASSLTTFIIFSMIMFCKLGVDYPVHSVYVISFLLGVTCGSSILAFQYIRNYVTNPLLKPFATSFVLTVSCVFYQVVKYILTAGAIVDNHFIKSFARSYKGSSCLFNCFFHHASFSYMQVQHSIFILAMICSFILTALPDISTVRILDASYL
ncbi:MAG: MFS transporter [Neisseriales bacterium]|nr:MAG: MFS transporter [Neisseriales bacterium]